MRHFILTSPLFEGEVEFVYTDNNLLYSFDFSKSEISEIQQKAILEHLPRHVSHLPQLTPPGSQGVITEIFQEVTFEMFWKRYFKDRYKDNSSKKRSEQKWKRLSKKDRVAAYNHIGKYMINVQPGTQYKLAETYLSAEVWNN